MKTVSVSPENFEEYFSVMKLRRVYEISPEIRFDGIQPDFIKFVNIDDQMVGFLGLEEKGIEKIRCCEHKLFHTTPMVLPPYFRMLKIEELVGRLEKAESNAIDVSDEEGTLFYKGQCKKTVLLNVCSFVYEDPSRHESQDFPSGTFGISLDPCGGDITLIGDLLCVRLPLAIASQSDTKGKNIIMMHNPLIFYIKSTDIEKSGDGIKICEKLRKKFEGFVDKVDGFFAIPLELPGKGLVYFFIPNAKGYRIDENDKNYPEECVSQILQKWIKTIKNHRTDEKNLYGAIDDVENSIGGGMEGIDDWSVLICRKSRLEEKSIS